MNFVDPHHSTHIQNIEHISRETLMNSETTLY